MLSRRLFTFPNLTLTTLWSHHQPALWYHELGPLGRGSHEELKMCLFHYKKFDSCGDYGIEISSVCDEALWRAGLRGVLQICVPRILERSLEWSGPDDHEPPKPAFFRGYDGFCEVCVEKFKVC